MKNGRPKIIALDIGATHIRVSYYSDGRFSKFGTDDTPRTGNSKSCVTDKIISLIYDRLSEEEIKSASSIGAASAGPLDTKKGEIINSPNMAFTRIEIKKALRDEFSKDVYLINDCRSGVLGEIASDESLADKNVVYITFSTGIGAGAFIDGNLILGKSGNAGEAGHFFVDSRYNLSCSCGGAGHWEAYSSGTKIPVFFREFCRQNNYECDIAPDASAETVFLGIKNKSRIYSEFAEELGKINSRGISTVLCAYSPDVIILDGPVVLNNTDVIIKGINRYTDRYLDMPQIRPGRLKGLAPLHGAAFYALNMQNKRGEND
ncbi:MAG: ROK family protein [Methanomicrobium sp.]|nr:ROK family protein [Methanomicrobium sp.]